MSKNVNDVVEENPNVISEIVSVMPELSDINRASTSDRFRYSYETSAKKLLSRVEVTAAQVKNTNICKTIATTILGGMTFLGTGTALAINLASDIHALNQDGTIYSYYAVKKRIKTNVVTGKRFVVGDRCPISNRRLVESKVDMNNNHSISGKILHIPSRDDEYHTLKLIEKYKKKITPHIYDFKLYEDYLCKNYNYRVATDIATPKIKSVLKFLKTTWKQLTSINLVKFNLFYMK
ncbi:hypothetical protein M2140_000193 [Clostridiales Family XIII bacterium PM5-7]